MPRGVPQGEALAVWALLAADVLAILVVYSVVDPSELNAVTGSGVSAGLGRALVQLDFPCVAGVAIPLALLALDVLPRRAWLAGGPAIVLCGVIAWPGVLDPNDLDARWVNVIPAVGVAVAFALTLAAARVAGAGFAPRRRGDPARVVLAAVTILVSLPWIAAEVGWHFPQGIFMTSKLYAEPGQPPTASVHLGHHHGWAGALLVLSVLVLSRVRLRSDRLRIAFSALLSLGVAYGAAILVNDLWHEQIVKRGWTTWDFPSALQPGLHPIWAVVLLAAGALYALGLGRRGEATPRTAIMSA
jgi:hypothetical protein